MSDRRCPLRDRGRNVANKTEAEIEQLILERLLSGSLPSGTGHKIFGGKGDGIRCACCDELVTARQIQYDVEPNDAQSLAMHLNCYNAWANAVVWIQRALAEAKPTAIGADDSSKNVFLIAYSYELMVKRAAILRASGYGVTSVVGNEAAKVVLAASSREYDLFIISPAAPEQVRLHMAHWLSREYPRIRILALNPGDNEKLDTLKYNANDNLPDVWLPMVATAASDRGLLAGACG